MMTTRRALLVGGLALTAFARPGSAEAQAGALPDDVVIGDAAARVMLTEYGSAMCGHCRAFEQASWPTLKREYIDAGKVRFTFREALAPTSPDGSIESVTFAMYQVSRCNGATQEQYFQRLNTFFDRQPAIQHSETMAIVREHLISVGESAGLTRDQTLVCLRDSTGPDRMRRLSEAFNRDGAAAGIPPDRMGTPMFFLNGRHIDTGPMMTPDGLRGVLEAALAAAG
ncbi:MAG: thioredoxin domain-containing protein [Terricaulis sp.]